MSIIKKIKSKLKDRRGKRCSFCPNIIHLHNEVNGVLHVASGKPICAVCRVMRKSKFKKKMKSDAEKANVDGVNENVEDVAIASQNIGDADSDKKKKLMKQLKEQVNK